ncbi:RHG1A [Symbiodinium sp. CCMP2592]|nr:RHG1A [Symbiodinium sp. CCMP2592]
MAVLVAFVGAWTVRESLFLKPRIAKLRVATAHFEKNSLGKPKLAKSPITKPLLETNRLVTPDLQKSVQEKRRLEKHSLVDPKLAREGIAAAGAADAVQAPDARPFPAASSSAGPAEQLPEASEASEASAAQAKATAKPSQAAAKKAAKATGMARGFLNKPAKKQNKKADSEATAPSASAASSASASTVAVPEPQKEGKATSSAATAVATATAAAEDSTSAAATRLWVKEIARAQEAGVAAFHNCSFREAKASFERMRDTARAAGLGREEGQASRLLANALDKLDAPEAEIDAAYQQAMRKAHQHDDMELSFNVLTGMGSHAIKAGDLDIAEHLYQQSLMLAQRVLTVHEQGIAEGNLGMCLGQMEGRRPESLDHFKKAIKLQQEGSNPHAIVTLIANFASALCADGKYQEAKKEYENALVLTRRIGDRRVEVNILTNLANLCENVLQLPEKARQYRAALKGEYSKDSCAICLEALDSEGRAQTVLQCSHIYHSACIDQILSSESQSRSKCPLCRNSFFSFTAAA